MKEALHALVERASTPQQALCQVREYLQARLLGGIQRAGGMVALAFHGGTALRFLYRLPRYSEDLDFALERAAPDFALRGFAEPSVRELRAEGYSLRVRLVARTAVHAAWFRFDGLLHELGLSPHAGQALSIKIEVDTRPPAGAVCTTSVVRRHLVLHLHHHDRASLLAGKLHAILQRAHAKGRDFFDLLWYLADPTWPEPNIMLLRNALRQTGFAGALPTASSWPRLVSDRLASLDWKRISADVEPFLEPGADADALTPANLMRLLEARLRATTDH